MESKPSVDFAFRLASVKAELSQEEDAPVRDLYDQVRSIAGGPIKDGKCTGSVHPVEGSPVRVDVTLHLNPENDHGSYEAATVAVVHENIGDSGEDLVQSYAIRWYEPLMPGCEGVYQLCGDSPDASGSANRLLELLTPKPQK